MKLKVLCGNCVMQSDMLGFHALDRGRRGMLKKACTRVAHALGEVIQVLSMVNCVCGGSRF